MPQVYLSVCVDGVYIASLPCEHPKRGKNEALLNAAPEPGGQKRASNASVLDRLVGILENAGVEVVIE